MPRKLDGTYIQTGSITTTQLSSAVTTQISAGGGPRVSSLVYPGNDTAANTVGGQTVYIVGSGFETNNAIYINGNAVPSKSFISASNVSFTTPALSAGIYPVYFINTDTGATAIFVPGLSVSAEPTWVTSAGSLSSSQEESVAWSYSLSSTGDTPITYALAAGSSLPAGISLAANGLISGTLSSPTGNATTYTFSVVATDAQNQDSTRQFSVTTSTGEGLTFANNVLLIHADGTNNQNNQTFVESSNNLTVTRTGSANQSSYSPFSQTGWSNYFDGSGDYLSVSANAGFDLVTGNFTVESWIYDQGPGAERYIFSNRPVNAGWEFRKNATNLLQFFFTSGSSITSTSTITPNVWTHVAVTRESSTVRIFINGNLDASASFSDGISGVSSALFLGYGTTGGGYFLGYMSNARIVKGTALYTSNFAPSTTPLTAVSNTQLLTCQSNRFRDASNNNFTVTRNGDTSIQPFSPFAPSIAYSAASVGGSVYIPSGTNGLSIASVPAIGSGNFTVEGWFWPTDDTVRSDFDSAWALNAGNFNGSDSAQGAVRSTHIIFRSNGTTDFSASVSIANRWSHIAWVRNGTTVTIYLNGVSVATATYSNSISGGTAYISRPDSNQFRFNGYISGFRVVNSAVYTGAFTPPTSPPTNIANTSLLLNFTNAGIYDQTAKSILELVGDAKVSTAQYKYGTGSIVFDGTGDAVRVFSSASPSPLFKFGSSDFTIEAWVYFNTVSARGAVFNQGWGTGSYATDGGFTLDIAGESSGQMALALGTMNSGAFWIRGGSFNVNTWYHIAMVRNGTTITIYKDGVSAFSGNLSSSSTLVGNMGFITAGAYTDNTLAFNGYMDDLRITRGYARYTSTFTPPSATFKDK